MRVLGPEEYLTVSTVGTYSRGYSSARLKPYTRTILTPTRLMLPMVRSSAPIALSRHAELVRIPVGAAAGAVTGGGHPGVIAQALSIIAIEFVLKPIALIESGRTACATEEPESDKNCRDAGCRICGHAACPRGRPALVS
jgi:hypothetical protein